MEEWKPLLSRVATERFGEGDAMSLIYRTATYLQSIAQAMGGPVGDHARDLRSHMFRSPLDFVLTT